MAPTNCKYNPLKESSNQIVEEPVDLLLESPKKKNISSTSHHNKKRSIHSETNDPTNFTLLKVIGRGTFAQQVALARNKVTKDLYAIKTLDKKNLVRRKQVAHTITERKVLEKLSDHPFIITLYDSFQTSEDIHFVLEWCQGGELFYHLQQQSRFVERDVVFYAAEILSALECLHSCNIVYRDLKPENVLLDAAGHIRLADFGFAKENVSNTSRTFSFCGSLEYLSPEMLNRTGHNIATDMWSFGCLCYELLTGTPPFQASNENMNKLFTQIRHGSVYFPNYLSPIAVSFLQGLLQVDSSKRMTAKEAMKHPFFKSIDWNHLQELTYKPPFQPEIEGVECTSNFDDGFTCLEPESIVQDKRSFEYTPERKVFSPVATSLQEYFRDF